jgi:Mn-dependent DtxR family transcriptional regulator
MYFLQQLMTNAIPARTKMTKKKGKRKSKAINRRITTINQFLVQVLQVQVLQLSQVH